MNVKPLSLQGSLALVLHTGQTLGQGGCCRPQAQSAPALARCWSLGSTSVPVKPAVKISHFEASHYWLSPPSL
ncbi:Liprin-Alpha-4 [Manis pentadactyla]|nr:Liprin-Alpha-4 [Manis pentadactyla]